jgi:CubicO group peptidase (beta-lactamase class C family)
MRIKAASLAVIVFLLISADTSVAAEADLQRFIDGVISQPIVKGETVGATVVQDGRLVMAKGYGQRSCLRGLPVDGRATQFQIGSITKVLVWISVLQQV